MAVKKVEIVQDDCISCEQCVTECDAVFEMADDKCVVKKEAQDPAYCAQHTDCIKAAVESCPSEAIKIEEG